MEIDLPDGLIRYDYVGIQAYRKCNPQEPDQSSGEWLRADEVAKVIPEIIKQVLEKTLLK